MESSFGRRYRSPPFRQYAHSPGAGEVHGEAVSLVDPILQREMQTNHGSYQSTLSKQLQYQTDLPTDWDSAI